MNSKEDEKPQPPAPSECCEGGCEVCVWDVYFEALAEWQKKHLKSHTAKKDENS